MRRFIRLSLSVFLASVGIGAAADEASNQPMGYWEKEIRGPSFPYRIHYMLGISPSSPVSAESMVDRIVQEAGGKGAALPHSDNSIYCGRAVPLKGRMYDVPTDAAEAAARKIIGEGVLRTYTITRVLSPSSLDELQRRIASISAEIKQNEKALNGMPISLELLTNRLNRLKAAEAETEAALKQASLLVVFCPQADEGKK